MMTPIPHPQTKLHTSPYITTEPTQPIKQRLLVALTFSNSCTKVQMYIYTKIQKYKCTQIQKYPRISQLAGINEIT